jgi:hypothetical protein
MLKRKRHNLFATLKKQRGMALLIIMSFILIAASAIAISRLSLNSILLKRQEATTVSMVRARDALIAYAMTQPIPGRIPCPDTDNNGTENLTGLDCTSRIGLLPYRTLNIPQMFDGANQVLWYAVDASYAGILIPPHNSSRVANLRIDAGSPQIFIIIAANTSLPGQSPATPIPANIAQFLEDDNANATLNSYTNIKNVTQNDLLLGVSSLDFWMSVEKRVLDDAKNLMENYRTACPAPIPWPWAATFGSGISVVNIYEGSLPLVTALPINWATGCAGSVVPGYLATHWNGSLYYAICKDAVPVNPPATSCLTFGSKTAKAIILSPGIVVGTQNRIMFNINQYFEGNDISPNDNQFDLLIPGATDNDLLVIIEP